MRLRTVSYAGLAAAVVAAGGLVGWWYVVANRAEAGAADWARNLEARGYAVTYAEPERSGFPARVELTFRDATLKGPPEAQIRRMHMPVITAHAPLWNPERVRFASPAGLAATLDLGGERLDFSSATLDGTLDPEDLGEDGRAWFLRGELSGLRAAVPDVPEPLFTAEAAVVDVGIPEVLLYAPDTVATLQLRSRIEEIVLAADAPLGDSIAEVIVASDVTAPLPGAWSAPALAAWRDRGGRIALRQSGMVWGPLQVEGAGQLALDAALRPEGTIEIRARGYEAALDALVQAGILPTKQVAAMKLALAFMSRQPTPDGPREAGAELALDDGWLKLGPFQLAPLPPVVPR